ncbi:hypothetical protein DOY81_005400 [Sarcophaga bullata]|nr:hypothetical protein DOY81_005400 [Sarcophaga bullata]
MHFSRSEKIMKTICANANDSRGCKEQQKRLISLSKFCECSDVGSELATSSLSISFDLFH